MIVVSDTSVISNLYLAGYLDLLPRLFSTVVIPQKVQEELLALKQFGIDVEPILQANFLTVKVPVNQAFIQTLMQTLDEGEAQAISLAVEIQADLLVIDELKGRVIAIQNGLNITGLLGLLVRAKQNGILPKVQPVMDLLKTKANFFISEKLYAQILQLAGE